MIEFGSTMDPHSLDVRKNGQLVGTILWHPGEAESFDRLRSMVSAFQEAQKTDQVEADRALVEIERFTVRFAMAHSKNEAATLLAIANSAWELGVGHGQEEALAEVRRALGIERS